MSEQALEAIQLVAVLACAILGRRDSIAETVHCPGLEILGRHMRVMACAALNRRGRIHPWRRTRKCSGKEVMPAVSVLEYL